MSVLKKADHFNASLAQAMGSSFQQHSPFVTSPIQLNYTTSQNLAVTVAHFQLDGNAGSPYRLPLDSTAPVIRHKAQLVSAVVGDWEEF